MYFHASQKNGLKTLIPNISNHRKSLIYFSDKRENVLVYLSNPVEKFIKEKYNRPLKQYEKWASYGFMPDGRIRLEEYYKDALKETFKGVKGYVYYINRLEDMKAIDDIKNVFITEQSVAVDGCEIIDDAYEEILKAEKSGKIVIERFEDISESKHLWIIKTILIEYNNTQNEDYKEFLKEKFEWLK